MTDRRTAIVTGGGRGIGRGVSLGLATDGMAVAVIYYSRQSDAEEVVNQILSQGGMAQLYQADVAQAEQIEQAVSRVMEAWERIDVLVNNAGVASRYSTQDLPQREWDRVLAVNLTGAFLCSQAVIPIMRRQGYGRIINISSIAGQTGGAIGPHYAASKAGLIGLTRFMARELGPYGITVNALAPSGVWTELLSDLGFQPNPNRPVGRQGVVEDVAAAVRYFASPEAGYVTGQLLGINGGSFLG